MSDCMTKKENPQPSQACKYVGSYIADFTAKSSTTSKYKICGKELRLSGNTFNLIDISPIIICMVVWQYRYFRTDISGSLKYRYSMLGYPTLTSKRTESNALFPVANLKPIINATLPTMIWINQITTNRVYRFLIEKKFISRQLSRLRRFFELHISNAY